MTAFVARRIAQSVVVAFGISVLVFALIHLVPGDPIRLAMGLRFEPEAYQALYERAGFDSPVVLQYLGWLGDAVRGDLGVSFYTGRPVTTLLLNGVAGTVALTVSVSLVAMLIAFPAGIFSALRAGRAADRFTTAVTQIGISVPDFWSALMLVLVFALSLGWFPPSGYVSPIVDFGGWLRHLALPTLTVGIIGAAVLTRFVRSAMQEELSKDYVRTAQAKGLPKALIIRRHVLRNALVPIITVIGVQLGFLLGGVVVVEVIFGWPGVGRLAFDAVLRRDYSVLQGAVLFMGIAVLAVNFVVDMLYAAVDPRIRY